MMFSQYHTGLRNMRVVVECGSLLVVTCLQYWVRLYLTHPQRLAVSQSVLVNWAMESAVGSKLGQRVQRRNRIQRSLWAPGIFWHTAAHWLTIMIFDLLKYKSLLYYKIIGYCKFRCKRSICWKEAAKTPYYGRYSHLSTFITSTPTPLHDPTAHHHHTRPTNNDYVGNWFCCSLSFFPRSHRYTVGGAVTDLLKEYSISGSKNKRRWWSCFFYDLLFMPM